ncbi:Arginase, catabolizes arginine to ornithine and urea [Coelomomyces lativittatus]|nr:Arginase, catabolizes arginine to ornithine and urea [Coelomomyces lativittatus]
MVDPRCHDLTHQKPKDDPPYGKLRNPKYVSNVCHHVSALVAEHALAQHFVLTLGGDHTIALGTVHGMLQKYGDQLRVIWVDAHADINTPTTSTSGNLHGCPVSFLMGFQDCLIPHFEWCTQVRLLPHQLVYIGLRDVDLPERKLLRQANIKCFSMFDVTKFGIGAVLEMAVSYLNPDRNLPMHLSFDVDALDPSVVSATGTPVPGGLTFREGIYICQALHATGLLVSMDVVEVNPALAEDAHKLTQTVSVGCALIRSALGETFLDEAST